MMISFRSIWGITIRLLYVLKRDLNFMLASLYWPLLDILIWGFLGAWIAKSQPTSFQHYETVALLGILLWQIIGRGCNIMIISFAEELWSNNIVNMFSLPLCITEWIYGIILFYGIMMGITSIFCMIAIFLLYNIPAWYMISTFLIFMPPLVLSAIWIGFTCLQIIVTLGRRGVEIGFIFGWFLLPFSGAYYPTDILPAWGQTISRYLPMSYVFQAMREYVSNQQDPTALLIKGYALSILYATCSIIVFIYCFNRSKQTGLARLVD